MRVLYTCDNNYIWIMSISMISLFENNGELEDLSVYLLGDNVSGENKKILYDIGLKYNRKITVIDVPKLEIPQSLVSRRWPLSAFIRLYSGLLLPNDYTSILYLDCDTIVCGDISQLGYIENNNYAVYGIRDCVSSSYKKNIGLDREDVYINAGVLMLNLTKLREINIKDVINKYMNCYESLISYADQDILNGIFNKNIGVLPPEYNVMTIDVVHTYKEIQLLRKPTNFYTKEELTEAVKNPVIIHYTTNMRVIRPWYSNTDHPLAFQFLKYMKISPWSGKTLYKMEFNSIEKKAIGIVNKLPKLIAFKILGMIHSKIRPICRRIRTIGKEKR